MITRYKADWFMKKTMIAKIGKNGNERLHSVNLAMKMSQDLFEAEPGINKPIMGCPGFMAELVGVLIIGIVSFPFFVI